MILIRYFSVATQDIVQFEKDRTKITVGIGLGLLLLIGLIVYISKKER